MAEVSYTEQGVSAVRVRAYCKVCDKELQYTGVATAAFPCRYDHVCPKCGRKQQLPLVYPHIEYRDKPLILVQAAEESGE